MAPLVVYFILNIDFERRCDIFSDINIDSFFVFVKNIFDHTVHCMCVIRYTDSQPESGAITDFH